MQGSINSKRRLRRVSFGVLPGHCLLCRAGSQRNLDLCHPCESELPRLGPHCAICAAPFPTDDAGFNCTSPNMFCGQCLRQAPHFDWVFSPFAYDPPLDHLLSRFKFNSDLVAGQVLGELLANALKTRMDEIRAGNGAQSTSAGGSTPDWIIPTPLHWRRNLSRGFNQASELAGLLSKKLKTPINHRLIKRGKATQPQLRLKQRERRQNLRHAFTLASPQAVESIEGRAFAVVDDILTTGSTAEAIASLLKKYGATEVSIWAVARTRLEN